MATTKKRVNISISKETEEALTFLAKRDQVPQATKAEHLLRIALEMEEDQVLDELAARRDKKGARMVSHTKAWQ